MYNTVLLSIETKLYTRSLELNFKPESIKLNLNVGSENYQQEEKLTTYSNSKVHFSQ